MQYADTSKKPYQDHTAVELLFEQHLKDFDCLPEQVACDAKTRHCATVWHPKNKKFAWYVLSYYAKEGRYVGKFGAFNGLDETWEYAPVDDTPEQRKRREQQAAKDKADRERTDALAAKREQRKQQAARLTEQRKVAYIEQHTTPAAGHDYLTAKGFQAVSCLTYKGALAVPYVNAMTGKLSTWQFITTSQKRFLRNTGGGAAKKGACHILGTLTGVENLALLCEGFATGLSMFLATSLPTVVCADAGNLWPVLTRLTRRFPNVKEWRVCADNDAHKPTNTGKDAALTCWRKCNKVSVVWPEFPDAAAGAALTDFNDLMQCAGLPAVKQRVLDTTALYAFPYTPSAAAARPQPDAVLPNDKHLSDVDGLQAAIEQYADVTICAETGTGKTFYALNTLPQQFPQKNIILFEPTRLLADAKAKDARNRDGERQAAHVVKKGSRPNKNRVQVSTYNGVTKFDAAFLQNSICVIDESQNGVTCQGYRPEVIAALKQAIAGAWRRVFMTGTPLMTNVFPSDKTFTIYKATSDAVDVEFVETSNKRKTLETLAAGEKTKLVYVFSREDCDKLAEEKARKGYFVTRIHSETERDGVFATSGHADLVNYQKIDAAYDYVFATSYACEGVDVLTHNVKYLFVYDFIPPYLLKQLTARFREHGLKKVFLLTPPMRNRRKCNSVNFDQTFTPKDVTTFEQQYTAAANAMCQAINNGIDARLFDIRAANAKTTINTLQDCLEQHGGRYMVNPDKVKYLVYKEQEEACRKNPQFYIDELAKYGLNVDSAQARKERETAAEKALYKGVCHEIAQHKVEQFNQDLLDAAAMSDRELAKVDMENDTTAKERLRILTLTDRLTREQAVKVLRETAGSDSRFQTARCQWKVRKYIDSSSTDAALDAWLTAYEENECVTPAEIFRREKAAFKDDGVYAHLLKLTGTRALTQVKAVRHSSYAFTTERTRNAAGEHVYRIVDNTPRYVSDELIEKPLPQAFHDAILQAFAKNETDECERQQAHEQAKVMSTCENGKKQAAYRNHFAQSGHDFALADGLDELSQDTAEAVF